MTQEQRELLLKDLCARLPYGVKIQIKNEIVVLDSVCDDDGYHFNFIGDDKEGVNIEQIKPYLFPMSSMTDEQKNELNQLFKMSLKVLMAEIDDKEVNTFEFDFYNKYHLDWRGLIPKGLALDATGLNIY